MKNSYSIPALLVIIALSAIASATAQTTVFNDNFDRATFTTGNSYGTPPILYTLTPAPGASINTTLVSGSNYVANLNSGTTASRSLFSAPISGIPGFNPILNANSGLVTWTFNMRTNTAVTTNTPTSGTVAGGIDLCSAGTGNIYAGVNVTGYGVVFNSSATGGVALVKLSSGFNFNTVLITQTTTVSKTDFYSVRVTYDPATNNWSLYMRDDGASAFADPSTGVISQQGTTVTDNTYTGSTSSMKNYGVLYTWSSGTYTMSVDNFSIAVGSSTPCSGTPVAGTVSATQTAGCTVYTPTLSLTGSSTSTGLSYQWMSSPDNITWTPVSGAIFLPFVAPAVTGNVYYSCQVTCNSSGLSSSTPGILLTLNSTPPSITVSHGVSICAGSSTALTVSGGTSYSWAPSTGLNTTTGTSVTANPTTTTIYTVTGTTSGCSNTATVVVTVNTLPSIGITVSPYPTVCSNTSVTLSGTGASTYSWTGGITNATPFTATATNNYTVTGTDVNGCNNTATQIITVNAPPTISAGPNVAICNGSSTTLTASGGTTYSWVPSTGLSATTGASVIANPTSTTTYTVTETSSGCYSMSAVMVTVNALPAVAAITGINSTYAGEISVLSDATPGGIWTSSNASIATVGSTGVVTGVAAGSVVITYSVASGGCTGYATYSMTILSSRNQTTVFTDNFDRTTFTTGNNYGTPPIRYTFSLGTLATINTTLVSGSNYVANLKSGISASSSSYFAPINSIPGLNPILNMNSGVLIWTFNMRTSIAVTTNSPTSGSIAGGFALCSSGSGNILNGPTTGYGVVFNSGATGGVSLVKFSAGLTTNTALITQTTTVSKTDFYSILVTYDPSTDNWSLYMRDDGATGFADPSSGVTLQQGSTVTDNTYTGSAMVNYGVVYTWSTGSRTMTVDNFSITVNQNQCSGTPIPGNTLASTTNICTGDTTNLSLQNTFTPGTGIIYQWSSATDISGSPGAYSAIAGAISATYTPPAMTATTWFTCSVTCTMGSSTGTSNPVKINVNALPTISASSDTAICTGSSTTLTGSGGTAYSWAPSVGLNSTIGTSVTANPTSTTTYTITGTDVNGCTNTATSTITVLGIMNFAPQVKFNTGIAGNDNPFNLAIGDLDGDGKPDLAVTNYNTNVISVYLNTSVKGLITANSFAASISYVTGTGSATGSTDIKMYDIDGDGKLDIVVVNQVNRDISVFRNISTGGSLNFAPKVDFSTGISSGNSYSIAIGDIDGDGKPDIAVTNANTISILRNTSTIGSVNFAANVYFNTGVNPSSVSMGDIDGDGKPDIVVVNQSSNTVSVYRNTSTIGSITLASNVDYTTNTTPYSVSISDFDGDGKPDLAVTDLGSSTVSVYRNSSTIGSIAFADEIDFNTGTEPIGIATGDMDGDGKLDIVVANFNANTVSVIRNISTSGSIAFANKVDYATGPSPRYVAIGDIDGDGKPDIAVTNFGFVSSWNISVFHNDDIPVIKGPASLCQASSITLSNAETGGIWSSSNPSVANVVSNSGVISGLTLGTAIITYTLATGCITTASITVTTGTAITAGPDTAICIGSLITLTASGGDTYSWVPSDRLSCSNCASSLVNPIATTTYTVTVSDAGGCSNIATVTVVVNPLPTIDAGSGASICNGTSAILTATGSSLAYSWGPSVELTTTTGATVTAIPFVTTIYSVTGTDANGCTNRAYPRVIVNPLPAVGTTVTPASIVCNGTIVTLSGTGANTYSWTGGISDAAPFTPATTNNYVVTGTDGNGCSNSASVTITVNPAPMPITGNQALCLSSNTISLGETATGGTWASSDGSVAIVDMTTGILMPSTNPGNATITYSNGDGIGCSASITVTVNTTPTRITGSPVLCVGGDPIILTETASGGTWVSSDPQ